MHRISFLAPASIFANPAAAKLAGFGRFSKTAVNADYLRLKVMKLVLAESIAGSPPRSNHLVLGPPPTGSSTPPKNFIKNRS